MIWLGKKLVTLFFFLGLSDTVITSLGKKYLVTLLFRSVWHNDHLVGGAGYFANLRSVWQWSTRCGRRSWFVITSLGFDFLWSVRHSDRLVGGRMSQLLCFLGSSGTVIALLEGERALLCLFGSVWYSDHLVGEGVDYFAYFGLSSTVLT